MCSFCAVCVDSRLYVCSHFVLCFDSRLYACGHFVQCVLTAGCMCVVILCCVC